MTDDDAARLTLYVKSTTPTRLPLVWMLRRVDVPFVTVDVRVRPQAAAELSEINQGCVELPAVVFEDGHVLNRPTAFTLRKHLQRRGFTVDWAALLLGSAYDLLVVGGALAALVVLLGY